jgi:hypothetical protein
MIEFQCRKCKRWMKAPNNEAGDMIECDKCGKVNEIPVVPIPVEIVGCGLWCLIVIAVAAGLAALGMVALLAKVRL